MNSKKIIPYTNFLEKNDKLINNTNTNIYNTMSDMTNIIKICIFLTKFIKIGHNPTPGPSPANVVCLRGREQKLKR